MLKQNFAQYRYLLEPTLAVIGVSIVFWSVLTVGSMIASMIATP